LHVFFCGHAVNFLKPNRWLGFLTSSQWLDVEYGFPLQHFLLERFRIAAIIESRIEPWFVGARVQTAATMAQLVRGVRIYGMNRGLDAGRKDVCRSALDAGHRRCRDGPRAAEG